MSHVFVSYKAEDRARVRPLVEALEKDGYSVWWDQQIGGGASWRQTIEAELDQAKCVVVMWSKRSAGREGAFVQDEAARAQRRQVCVPVLLDKVRPPLGFGETQALPLAGWHGDRSDPRYAAVLHAVRCIAAGGDPAPLHHPREGGPLNRRSLVLGGGAAVIAAGATGAWFLLRPAPAAASDSIAVLPFDNLSGDPSQAYFSDGMAEELRSALSRIPRLEVVARTSSEAVRNEDAKVAANKLGVASILTGSVRRSTSMIRVSAQLVDGRTGLQRWSQDFDEPIGDPLSIQSNIAQSVAEALRIQLAGATKETLTLGGTRNAAAQDLFLRSNPAREKDSAQGYERSIAQLDSAIQLDPRFARAYARKSAALAYYAANYAHSVSEMDLILNQAATAARQSIAIAPNLSQAHAALAFTHKLQLKFKDAWLETRAALNLPGVDAETMWRYGIFLSQIGRRDEALDTVVRATRLDPLNPLAYRAQALVLFLLHRFPLAVAAASHSLQLDPSGNYVRSILANSLLMMRRYAEAAAEYSKLPDDDANAVPGRAVLAALTEGGKASDRLLERLRATFGDTVNYECARVYGQRGDADTAIAYLQKAVASRNVGLIFVISDPFLDPIRTDARLSRIIRALDFPR